MKNKMATVGSLTKNSKGIVNMAVVVAIGLAILGNIRNLDFVTANINTSLGKFVTGIGSYADWASLLVLIGVAAYLFGVFDRQ